MISEETFMVDLYEEGIDTEITLTGTKIYMSLIDIETGSSIVDVEGDDVTECLKKALINCTKYASIFNQTLTGLEN